MQTIDWRFVPGVSREGNIVVVVAVEKEDQEERSSRVANIRHQR